LIIRTAFSRGADKVIAEETGVPPMTVQDFVASHRAALDSLDAAA
jgi:hypothetical protein